MNDESDGENWLLDEDEEAEGARNGRELTQQSNWRILVVDDEVDIHTVTRLALNGVQYKGRCLEILSAYSRVEALRVLSSPNDIALIFLDVMMETDDAGLRLAKEIREELKNHLVRVVLRTGQPGQAPERDIIVDYDINDYKSKTELTNQKLFTTVISSLRAYEGLTLIERSRIGMERILEASTDLYHAHSLREFASSVLSQISTILDVGTDGLLCLLQNGEVRQNEHPTVVAATGVYLNMTTKPEELNEEMTRLWNLAERAFDERQSRFSHPTNALYVESCEHRRFVVLVSPPWPLAELQKSLLELFCNKIGWAFDNLHHFTELQQKYQEFVVNIKALLAGLDSSQLRVDETLLARIREEVSQLPE